MSDIDNIPEKRGPGRPPNPRPEMHPEDPRARAKARAAEIMDHMGTIDDSSDKFYIPQSMIPDGWSWEWKRKSTVGKEDTANINGRLATGWEFVDASRFPDLHTEDASRKIVVREGVVLMERPAEVTKFFADRMKKEARDQVRFNEAKMKAAPTGDAGLPDGFSADNNGVPIMAHGVKSGHVKSSWSKMPISE